MSLMSMAIGFLAGQNVQKATAQATEQHIVPSKLSLDDDGSMVATGTTVDGVTIHMHIDTMDVGKFVGDLVKDERARQ